MEDLKNKDEQTRLDRLSLYMTTKRKMILVIILIITGIFLYGISMMKSEILLQDMFPYDHPYPKLHARFSQVFGTGASTCVIAIKAKQGDIFNKKTLTKIKAVTEDISLNDAFYRNLVVSIARNTTKVANARAKGEITFDCIMFPNVPENGQEMEKLKKDIFSTPSIKGLLVSNDGTAALVMAEMKENISYEKMFQYFRGLVTKYSDNETSLHMIGYPILMGWIFSMKSQILTVFLFSILSMIVILFIIFRGNLLGIIVVVVNVLILTIWGLGFIGFTGINFSPLLYVLGFLIGARMVSNSYQIAYRYFEELDASHGDRNRACYETMRTMLIPNFAAVTTDSAGFLVLIVAKIALMQDLAIIMTFWMTSIMLTGFLVPVICTMVPLKINSLRWAKETCTTGLTSRIMMKITGFSIDSRGRYLVGAAIIGLAIFCGLEMSNLKIGDPTPGSPIFYGYHTFNRDTAIIDKLFSASSDNFTLFYEGSRDSVYDPVVTRTFEAFDRHMADSLKDIYKASTSIIGPAKSVNMVFHDGDMAYYQLPTTEEGLVGMFGMVTSKMSQAARRTWMDDIGERSNISLFFADHTSDNLLRIRDAAYNFFKNHPMKVEKGEFMLAGGRVGMEIAVNEEMMRTHAMIDIMVLTAIFILCTWIFMSVTAGLMLTLPLILANSVAAAYMSITNIGLSINTLPIAAIGAGVGVDFAIYLYSRMIEEYSIHRDWQEATIKSICTCGKAVLYTGVTIIIPILGWYFFSDMKFQGDVGFFLSMIMVTNILLTLTLHPLMLYFIKPKFVTRSKTWAL